MFQIKQDSFDQQAAIALSALGQHIHSNQLRAPMSIDIYDREQLIRVRVAQDAAEAWLTSVLIDAEENEPATLPGVIRTTWSVRLPEMSLIVFELVALRPAPPMLQAVSA